MDRLHVEAAIEPLARRIGPVALRQRLGLEADHEARVFGQGRNFFHLENWYSVHGLIRGALRLALAQARGRRNALDIRVRRHEVRLARLPPALDGFTILQLSDLHLDMSPELTGAICRTVEGLDYELCVLTGDYRARTLGPCGPALEGLRRLRRALAGPVYAVLGNHDSIRMVPPMEDMGMRVLLNESVRVGPPDAALYLAGIDDPHYYRADNLERAARRLPPDGASVLLSHSPEMYRHAAHAGFDLMLCGHTHGGQICLPGGIPLFCNARAPRRMCAGWWRYHDMQGYTSAGAGVSIVDVRLNCPPEVTLHRLRSAQPQ